MSSGIPSFQVMADVLASEGVINYDAEAYVKGTKPRYIGRPATYANSGSAYPVTDGIGIYSNPYRNNLHTTLGGDAFVSSSKKVKAPVKDYKALKEAGAIAALGGTGYLLLRKCSKKAASGASALKNKIKGIFSKGTAAAAGATTTASATAGAAATGAKGKISTGLSGLKNTIKTKLTAAGTTVKSTKIGEKAANVLTGLKSKVSAIKVPGKFKVAAVAALTLFGAYKVATHEKKYEQFNGSIHSVPKY